MKTYIIDDTTKVIVGDDVTSYLSDHRIIFQREIGKYEQEVIAAFAFYNSVVMEKTGVVVEDLPIDETA